MYKNRADSPLGRYDAFERLAIDLEQRGFSIQPAGLPVDVASSLADHLDQLDAFAFHTAGVGRGPDPTSNRFIRRNKIHWIDEADRRASNWIRWTDELRRYLNERLYLGLFSFESHFTRYEAGDFYRRHMDAFRGERNRIVSLVTYLNDGWLPDQGGELVLYPGADKSVTVTPASGTIALFLSEEIPHEVLPTRRTRHGVAGWFRLNTSGDDQIDPPK